MIANSNFTIHISQFTLISHLSFTIDSHSEVCEMVNEKCKMLNTSEGGLL